MATDLGYRDIILIAAITILIVTVVFLAIPTNKTDNFTEYNSPEEISEQNSLLEDALNAEMERNKLLEKNNTLLTSILAEQDKLIIKLNDRLENYKELGTEVISPTDRIAHEKIFVKDDEIIIKLSSASKGTIINTYSELPLLNENSTTLEIKPRDETDIHIGDIIVYYSNSYRAYIIHRVISQGVDNEGWFVITKGDNNFLPDDELVRFAQIKSIVVGIIY
jgi:hypothetical protein